MPSITFLSFRSTRLHTCETPRPSPFLLLCRQDLQPKLPSRPATKPVQGYVDAHHVCYTHLTVNDGDIARERLFGKTGFDHELLQCKGPPVNFAAENTPKIRSRKLLAMWPTPFSMHDFVGYCLFLPLLGSPKGLSTHEQ